MSRMTILRNLREANAELCEIEQFLQQPELKELSHLIASVDLVWKRVRDSNVLINLEKNRMPKQIQLYSIPISLEPQSIEMPRRARITGVHLPNQGSTRIFVYAEVEHDANTAAFDTGKHSRYFACRRANDMVPEGAGVVGFSSGVHVYEVKEP